MSFEAIGGIASKPLTVGGEMQADLKGWHIHGISGFDRDKTLSDLVSEGLSKGE